MGPTIPGMVVIVFDLIAFVLDSRRSDQVTQLILTGQLSSSGLLSAGPKLLRFVGVSPLCSLMDSTNMSRTLRSYHLRALGDTIDHRSLFDPSLVSVITPSLTGTSGDFTHLRFVTLLSSEVCTDPVLLIL